MGAVILMYDPSNYKKNKPMDLLSDIKMDYDDMGPYKISSNLWDLNLSPAGGQPPRSLLSFNIIS